MRPLFVLLHRWFGLAVAIFLFISGLTGAFISWDHELDALLNPRLFHARSAEKNDGTKMLSGLELANRVEASDPAIWVTYVLNEAEPGHTVQMSVEGKINPVTGKPYELGFNQIAVDPVSGEIQGKRQWGEISLSRENLLPFLYKLHYTMHIPNVGGIELGIWLMGIIGMVWVLDCFIALYLSFPNWRSWRKSLAFRWRQGGHKLNFDLHRSGGVWVWLLLLVLAITSVSMNLNSQVVRPLVQLFSPLSADVFATRVPQAPDRPVLPLLSREQVMQLAQTEAQQRGWTLPAGGVFYSPAFGVYGVGFFEAGNDHGDGGLGNAWLYFDGSDGHSAGAKIPGSGSAGDIFLQAQFPLHSGRILGLSGRIFISIMGLVVAMLSVTGVLIWIKKRRARNIR
ncbi:PepSY-associated TM helix domain-containing protein [Undibacterium sp. RTI2.1]|uniref:PepSY-associated TM helix domain-containing protein n=1 Tax=unclassified Undibacterium TaxID=2630295 RepID=UPI002AB497EF|nr:MULTISPECIES: PepSY-associated TM helix domain-containing protein [unclassified Undibacterium]MDY7538820.1 PepSY-associated TM helix domain-containing protein [Undibacterium sp. 5I1]MEB0031988.1 PepSY-associated TM helix domain-containing protein [Undibacterium sp. RTI2.1]MEB0118197.1 PepSY-associated TM helix domain-containing protein [Undibacterium sp. RTI2.2]MEB0231837.1 PepSY-associated TM helix domain-containing protein [Undibacterium sp. 10I3]MEB0258923.1 PepSY-associated TM helix dom